MTEPSVLLEALFYSAVSVLLVAVALVLTFLRPGNTPRRLLALQMGALAAYNLIAFSAVFPTGAPPGAQDLWIRWTQDMWIVNWIGFVALLAVYPSRIVWRSWHGAVLVFAIVPFVVGAALWFVDPGALYDAAPGEAFPGSQQTLLLNLTWGAMARVGMIALAASAIVRARVLPELERRAAYVVVPAAQAWLFTRVGARLYGVPAALTGLDPSGLDWLGIAYGGDCCGIVQVVYVSGDVLALAIAFVLARRAHAWVAAGLIGFGMLVPFHLNAFPINYFFIALAPMYAISRYGAFETRQAPAWVPTAVAGAAFVAVFLLVNLAILLQFPGSALGPVVGILLGAMLGGAAAVVVLPQGRALRLALAAPAHAEAAAGRLAPYRVALQRELAGGAASAQVAQRLSGLRTELGVTDQEHAAMEYMVRAADGKPSQGESLLPGNLFLGRYRVERMLGKGGHGTTWLCKDQVVQRDVVLKNIRAAGTAGGLDAVLREARAIGALQHAHVATLHDVQRVGDEAFIVMEYLGGGSLAQRLARGKLGAQEFRRTAEGLLRALEAVHTAGVVHRDVKPSNVLLTAGGEPKLADFGIAHIPGFETTAGAIRNDEEAIGTIPYMSPEQARGQECSAQSDLFSAAVTLYEAYTGGPYLAPRRGESAVEMQMRAASALGFQRTLPAIPALRAWFRRALDPSPERRFASARAMREALMVALPAPGTRPRQREPRL